MQDPPSVCRPRGRAGRAPQGCGMQGTQPWWELKLLLELPLPGLSSPCLHCVPPPPAASPLPALSPAQTHPGVSNYSPKPGYCKGGDQAGACPSTGGAGRGRSLGNSQTTATGPTGRTRLWVSRDAHPGAGHGYRLEHHCHSSTPTASFLPRTWFNMRESKRTIQNLKTGLWFVPPLLHPRAGGGSGAGAGAAPGGALRRTSIPPAGGCSHTHNTRLFAQLFRRLSLAEGLEGPGPAGRARPVGSVTSPSWRLLSSRP